MIPPHIHWLCREVEAAERSGDPVQLRDVAYVLWCECLVAPAVEPTGPLPDLHQTTTRLVEPTRKEP